MAPAIAEAMGAELEMRSLADDEQERRQRLDVGIEQLRLCVAPAELEGLIQALRPAQFAADPVFGIFWMRMPETFSDVLKGVEGRGGHVVWLGRDGVRVYGVGPDARAVLERLKRQLDPEARLPGLPFAV